jgi:hypothetical protein
MNEEHEEEVELMRCRPPVPSPPIPSKQKLIKKLADFLGGKDNVTDSAPPSP